MRHVAVFRGARGGLTSVPAGMRNDSGADRQAGLSAARPMSGFRLPWVTRSTGNSLDHEEFT